MSTQHRSDTRPVGDYGVRAGFPAGWGPGLPAHSWGTRCPGRRVPPLSQPGGLVLPAGCRWAKAGRKLRRPSTSANRWWNTRVPLVGR